MATDNEDKYKYTVGDIDELIDERGNSVIMLRKLAWGEGKEKLEIRKWIVDIDSERANKGVTFLTEEGPHNLTDTMVKLGFGNTENIISELSKRDDFNTALVSVIGETGVKRAKKSASTGTETYYDPKEALLA